MGGGEGEVPLTKKVIHFCRFMILSVISRMCNKTLNEYEQQIFFYQLLHFFSGDCGREARGFRSALCHREVDPGQYSVPRGHALHRLSNQSV